MALADYGDSFLAYDLAKLLIFYVNEFHKIKGVYIVKEITKECENE
jgi:hypothetical protein